MHWVQNWSEQSACAARVALQAVSWYLVLYQEGCAESSINKDNTLEGLLLHRLERARVHLLVTL